MRLRRAGLTCEPGVLANAGIRLTDVGLADLWHPVQLGIALGLFVGKQAGVFGAIRLAVRFGRAALPDGAHLAPHVDQRPQDSSAGMP
jgi:Na+/H+ antiporter NhaA